LRLVRRDDRPRDVTTKTRRAIARLLHHLGCILAYQPYQAFPGTRPGHLAFVVRTRASGRSVIPARRGALVIASASNFWRFGGLRLAFISWCRLRRRAVDHLLVRGQRRHRSGGDSRVIFIIATDETSDPEDDQREDEQGDDGHDDQRPVRSTI